MPFQNACLEWGLVAQASKPTFPPEDRTARPPVSSRALSKALVEIVFVI